MDVNDIIRPENMVYAKTPILTDAVMHYCPGCPHGTVHKVIAEVIEEMGIQDKTIGISPVGCAVLAYNYIDIDWEQAAHGRAPALATATKRLNPDKYVFTYQGDGDLASIGTAEPDNQYTGYTGHKQGIACHTSGYAYITNVKIINCGIGFRAHSGAQIHMNSSSPN